MTIYVSNPICKPLPSNPSISPNSAAWAALEFQSGHDNIGGLGCAGACTGNVNEGSEPLDQLNPADPSINVVTSCNKEPYAAGTCKGNGVPSGTPLALPVGMYVEQGSDHHCAADIVIMGEEFDGWLCDDPVVSPTLNLGGGGVCPWSGDGTGCSGSTATDIATSLGGIDPNALAAAEASPNGTLPYAISASVLCGDPSFVYPAKSSDGANTNSSSACVGHTGAGQRPPEGTRWFLNLTDAQINATNNLPYVKVLLRTVDREHYGGYIGDTNWSGAPGLSFAWRHDAWLGPAAELGINPNATPTYSIPVTTNGIDLSKSVTFCTNGTC